MDAGYQSDTRMNIAVYQVSHTSLYFTKKYTAAYDDRKEAGSARGTLIQSLCSQSISLFTKYALIKNKLQAILCLRITFERQYTYPFIRRSKR